MDAWLGTAAIILSRLLLAHRRMAAGFALGWVGSLAWCIYAARTGQAALLVVDGVMLAADSYGLARHLKW